MEKKKPSPKQASTVSLSSRFPRQHRFVTTSVHELDLRLIVSALRRSLEADPPVLSLYQSVQTALLLEYLVTQLPDIDQARPPNS